MGTKLGTNYHPPSLVQLPSKGNKWFVLVTKPQELQEPGKSAQVRRSTKTTDKRLTQSRLPAITNDIYGEFDKALNTAPLQAHAELCQRVIKVFPHLLVLVNAVTGIVFRYPWHQNATELFYVLFVFDIRKDSPKGVMQSR